MAKLEQYVHKGQKKLRCGYTTGSCAAGAAKAAVRMLLQNQEVPSVSLNTPKGISLQLDILEIQRRPDRVLCAVQKDGGDDPDTTDGTLVFAQARKVPGSGIFIDGGEGVGRVTRPGLACPVGQAAINPVPRRMIEEQARIEAEAQGYLGGLEIVISVPKGLELAKKTYNPRLGIEGGISILGTTGIVEPMSEQALVDTIRVEIKMAAAAGVQCLVVTPGNYGEVFTREYTEISLQHAVKCSNFVGETLDCAAEFEFQRVLLIGHIGKFIKLAGGIMNTHSHVADARMEILAAHAAMNGGSSALVKKIMGCVTTDEAVSLLQEARLLNQVMETVMEKIEYHVLARVHHRIEIGVIVFSNEYGVLGRTENTKELAALCRRTDEK